MLLTFPTFWYKNKQIGGINGRRTQVHDSEAESISEELFSCKKLGTKGTIRRTGKKIQQGGDKRRRPGDTMLGSLTAGKLNTRINAGTLD